MLDRNASSIHPADASRRSAVVVDRILGPAIAARPLAAHTRQTAESKTPSRRNIGAAAARRRFEFEFRSRGDLPGQGIVVAVVGVDVGRSRRGDIR